MARMLALLAALGCLRSTPANAQDYPVKPITIVVSAAPGGVTDALGRMLAQRFTEAWGQPGDRREPARRQQPDRRRIRDQVVARRPRAVHRPEATFVAQSEPLCQAAVRPGQGLHARSSASSPSTTR